MKVPPGAAVISHLVQMDWLTLSCSFCAARFKIKLAHAHLKGRCPVCGYRIKPPRPDLYEYKPLSVSDAHEPSGLVAEDEEWPEPGIVVAEEHAGEYRLSSTPLAPSSERPDPAGSTDIFGLGPQYDRERAQAALPILDARPVDPPLKFKEEKPPPAPDAKAPAPKALVKPAPAVPLDPIMDDVPIKPPPGANAAGLPAPAPEPATSQAADTLMDDILVPAAVRPLPPPGANAPGSPAETKGPRFAKPLVEPEEEVPVAQEAPKPAPIVGLYGFQDAPAGTVGITAPVSEFAHVHPSPQVAPLSEPEPQRPILAAKLAPAEPPAYAALPPTEEAKPATREELYQYRLSQAETKPYRPPKPPDNPLWDGVWNFAWQTSSIKMCVWLSLGFTAFLLVLGLAAIFIGMINEGATIVAGIGLICVILAGIWITLWTGSYASACTFKIVEETANGERDIPGPDGGWKEWFWSFLRLGFVIFCGVAACGLFGLCLPASAATVILLALWPAVFNTFFLSIMAGESFWAILHGQTIEKMGGKMGVTLKMYAWTFVLLAIVLGAGWLVIAASPWYALFLGVPVALCCLTYARMMGRVGMLLMAQEVTAKKQRKKKRKKEGVPPAAAQVPSENIEN